MTTNRLRGDGDSVIAASAASAQEKFGVSAIPNSSANDLDGKSFTFSTDRNDYYVWYNQPGGDGTPADPTLAGVSIPVTIISAAPSSTIVNATVAALSKLTDIGTSAVNVSGFRVTVREFVDVTDAVDVDTGFTVTKITDGAVRAELDSKFLILGSSGNIESLIGQDGRLYELDTSTFSLAENNRFTIIGSGLVAAAGDTPVKADNLALSGSGTGDFTAGGRGSSIGGVTTKV